MLPPDLYEQVINTALKCELSEIPDTCKSVSPIDEAESSKVLTQYLAGVVEKDLEHVLDNGEDISAQIGLGNQNVDLIQNTTQEADFATLSIEARQSSFLRFYGSRPPG